MAKFIHKSTSDFSPHQTKTTPGAMPAANRSYNSPCPRVPGVSASHHQIASGPQHQAVAPPVPEASAPTAIADIRLTRLQGLSAILNKSTSPKEVTEIFTSELRVMAKNTTDVVAILAQILLHYKANTPIHQQAQRERSIVCNGHWTAFFRKVAGGAQWLTNQWGGSPWLPADIRATAERLFGNSEPSLYVHMLVDITKAAQAKGMNLQSLWANNGELRVAMKKNASQYLTCQLVNGVIQGINGARVEETLKAPTNEPQDRTVIDLVNGTEKANRVDISSSDETNPIVQDPNSKAPIAQMRPSFPKTLGNITPKNNGAPEQSQPSPVTKGAQPDTPPMSKKRTFNQMNCEEASSYSKYEKLILNLNLEHLAELRGEALKSLEKAESDKASFDCALADLKGREDQIKQIRDQSKTLVDEMSNGMRGQSDQGVLAGVLASTGTAYVNGITSLLDSLLQATSDFQERPTAKELQAQRAEAVDKASKAKEQVQALDHIEKAWSIHQRYKEAKRYRQKLRDLLSETDERAIELEKACLSTFSQAEQED
ncbi:uncharacterized protein FSUBG_12063 [Fusarium subglutinans]|uniref:Uncharacterized protein n=1 Tax=Gibberella subglutinans TaxID=42677 RepID=A0A8H5L9L4_GIBSU|nr:uncharacterized protein FSUBG_12063 [Fusarium subglutinans]KAF5586676.1 hypothetical protein FSUBG_12063 [Fusarium subglutinans]